LYVLDVDAVQPGHCHVEAWAPKVPGISEVLHARLVDYAYPAHCHETWAVLIVDDGAIRWRHTATTPASYARSHLRRAAT
jgi:hypothetical protein